MKCINQAAVAKMKKLQLAFNTIRELRRINLNRQNKRHVFCINKMTEACLLLVDSHSLLLSNVSTIHGSRGVSFLLHWSHTTLTLWLPYKAISAFDCQIQKIRENFLWVRNLKDWSKLVRRKGALNFPESYFSKVLAES